MLLERNSACCMALAALLCAGCGALSGGPAPSGNFDDSPGDSRDPGADDDPGPAPGDGDDDGAPACDIQAVMARPENGCTNAGCHGAQYQGGLDLLSPGLEERLVGAVSQTDACGGERLVDPENPERSLLLRLIDPARFAVSPCGVMMPLGTTSGVSADTLACFESFVANLPASDDGEEPEPEPEVAAPESYVTKVKTLLTGKAASAEEIARVAAEPAALRELVASWVDTPEFAGKLPGFLAVQLQQRFGPGRPTLQVTTQRSPHFNDLRENLQESFVRTATAIVAEDRPFTQILTTRRWAVTTAMMVALAYLDETEQRLTDIKHTVVVGPGADSIVDRVWHVPTPQAGCQLRTSIRGDQMIDLMMGLVPCTSGAAVFRFTDSMLTDADFADWHMVDLEKAATQADVPLFYDVAKLRTLTRMPLTVPRVGFFTTPAFLENWETNEDNQYRVTTSQALIVALGQIFSPADPTVPLRQDGIDREHAEPGTTCFGCHQFIDPMRQYFARNFSFLYHRPDSPNTITPSFAFRGSVRDGGSLGDFATTLAQHPDFATGWTQKLCYWANSQPCDASSSEFQRVAQAFVASGYRFKQLLVELLSSPLVTFATPTDAGFVSITRRQHLCQLLGARLGVEAPCDAVRGLDDLIPEDDFSRGTAEPVQTAVTGLFHYAGAEKLCIRLASTLVGAGARFSTTEPEAVLDALVSDLMGLPAGHPRAVATRASLGEHYEEAKAASNVQTALRSAFVVACMAPEVMAVGL